LEQNEKNNVLWKLPRGKKEKKWKTGQPLSGPANHPPPANGPRAGACAMLLGWSGALFSFLYLKKIQKYMSVLKYFKTTPGRRP
jgi:hypothetical protein